MLLISANFTQGRTRRSSVDTFLDTVRLSQNGFADTPSGSVNVESTQLVLDIKTTLQLEINNSLDLLLFFQSSQNTDGGFGSAESGDSNWESTIAAVNGLQKLELNSSTIGQWTIFNYLNITMMDLLYNETQLGNTTTITPLTLNLSTMQIWKQYILASLQLGAFPTIPADYLKTELQGLQYANGTYESFELATNSLILLALLGHQPVEVDLASKFIRAYKSSDGAFSNNLDTKATLRATLMAIQSMVSLDRIWEIDRIDILLQFVLNQQRANSGFGEAGNQFPTVKSTWQAVEILKALFALDELDSPEVLQTEGFIPFHGIGFGLIVITLVAKRRKF